MLGLLLGRSNLTSLPNLAPVARLHLCVALGAKWTDGMFVGWSETSGKIKDFIGARVETSSVRPSVGVRLLFIQRPREVATLKIGCQTPYSTTRVNGVGVDCVWPYQRA